MSKSDAIKAAQRGLRNSTPTIEDANPTGYGVDVPTPLSDIAPKAKRERKPRDPNAAPREKKTLESELSKLRAKYEPELQKQRDELHALDVKRASLAAALRATESRVARIVAVMSEPNEITPPATDPTYGDNKPENDGEKLPEPVNPTGDPRFEPPAPTPDAPPVSPMGDPNNQ